ncbi:MAG: hypothetical protein K9G33_15130 [Sneathiella sp.]|nr:hypothetical protein [Sneathiella sp.]
MPKKLLFTSLTSNIQRALSTTTGMSRLFNFQTRTYKVTSIPTYNMTDKKFSDPNEDRLGCYMPTKEFNEYYLNSCKRLEVSPELDGKTAKLIEESGGEIDDIDDIHGQVQKPTIAHPVVSPIINSGGQSSDAPKAITWPAEYSDPVGFVGGLLKNVLMYSLESEVIRNLAFSESIGDLIADEPGEFSSILQYYVGFGAPITFNDLNFLLGSKGQTPLTKEQLADKKVVEKYVSTYLDSILPASVRKIKIDMTSQTIKILHVQSPHSSVVLKYKLKDGTDGYIGAEVGRPSFTYVDGKLVQNAHEQVVDPAVFQSMNRPAIKLPETLDEFDKLETGVTKDNFYKFDTKIPIQELPVESKPVVQAINLVDNSTDGKDTYLSDGTPGAITTQKIPNAKALAKVLYFVTGQKPYHALRFGGYFAHKALTGQSRACEALVVYGCDIGGIDPTDLLPVLSDLKQYDLSQEMRESVYENFLYIELSQGQPDSKQSNIFSHKAATGYLTLAANAFACMQVYRDLLSTSAQRVNDAKILKKPDPEAQDVYNRIEKETRNFMHRYEHMWAISAYMVINMHRNYGIEVLLDPVDEDQTVKEAFKGKGTSAFLTLARAMTNEKIKILKKLIADDTTTQNKEVKTVQQNSLDLAQKALAKFDIIEKEMNQ